ncbi:MAG: calcium-binding protein [Solirubrobacterales bacterium]
MRFRLWGSLRRSGPLGAAVLLLCGVSLLALPAAASTSGLLLIRGPSSSSHLVLAYSDGTLYIRGYLGGGSPYGCQGGRGLTRCPLRGDTKLAIRMGPSNDKIEVNSPLPVPLTVHLGDGSDKFIGNDEPDTCYPEGARRNRCIGGGGDDVCITGPRNSDCVGGPGDDYCRHSTGSDGCWGDEGNDVCVMGPGMDGCHGGAGNDRLYGGPDPDQLYGGSGRDYCDGGPGIGRSHNCERGPGH